MLVENSARPSAIFRMMVQSFALRSAYFLLNLGELRSISESLLDEGFVDHIGVMLGRGQRADLTASTRTKAASVAATLSGVSASHCVAAPAMGLPRWLAMVLASTDRQIQTLRVPAPMPYSWGVCSRNLSGLQAGDHGVEGEVVSFRFVSFHAGILVYEQTQKVLKNSF